MSQVRVNVNLKLITFNDPKNSTFLNSQKLFSSIFQMGKCDQKVVFFDLLKTRNNFSKIPLSNYFHIIIPSYNQLIY